MSRRAVGFCLALTLVGSGERLHAQEAEVTGAIRETLAAWGAGRFDDFSDFYHRDARGFHLDGGPLTGAFNQMTIQAAYAAGFRADVTLRDLEVRVFGDVAVAAGYLAGTLTLPGGATIPGTWRYSETRVLEEGLWKVVQFHFSPLTAPVGE